METSPSKLLCLERQLPFRASKTNYGPFRATRIWNDIIHHLKTNVEAKRRRHLVRWHDNCFPGSLAVDVVYQYLLDDKQNFAKEISRENALRLCQTLMEKKILEPVSRGLDLKKIVFEDGHCKLYRFVGRATRSSLRRVSDMGGGNVMNISGRRQRQLKRQSVDGVMHNLFTIENKEVQEHLNKKSTLVRLRSTGSVQLCPSLDQSFESQSSAPFSDCGTSQKVFKKVQAEIVLSELLVLMDVSSVETLLAAVHSEAEVDVQSDHVLANDDDMVNFMATGCCELPGLRPEEEPWKTSSLTRKKQLFDDVFNHYREKEEPLLAEEFFDVHVAILNMLLHRRNKRATRTFQLYLALLSSRRKNELFKLLRFMMAVLADSELQSDEQCFDKNIVVQIFTDCILRHMLLTHGLAAIVVMYLLENFQKFLALPNDVSRKVNAHFSQKAADDIGVAIPAPIFCVRISKEEYEKQRMQYTTDSLVRMLNEVVDDTKMSLKEKKQKLKQLQKHHPDIYNKHFSNMV